MPWAISPDFLLGCGATSTYSRSSIGLHAFNARIPNRQVRIGFYGLDLYSMHASMRALLDYLDKVDPEGAKRARFRYACFDHYGEDMQAYG
jgi:erythromycin esterase-like protein